MMKRMLELEASGAQRMAGDAMDVAHRIVDLVESPRPRLRHPMGRTTFVREVLRRLAPFWVIEA